MIARLMGDGQYRIDDALHAELEKLDGVRAAALSGAPVERITITPNDELGERGLQTTPLVIIDDETIGGADDLERWLQSRH